MQTSWAIKEFGKFLQRCPRRCARPRGGLATSCIVWEGSRCGKGGRTYVLYKAGNGIATSSHTWEVVAVTRCGKGALALVVRLRWRCYIIRACGREGSCNTRCWQSEATMRRRTNATTYTGGFINSNYRVNNIYVMRHGNWSKIAFPPLFTGDCKTWSQNQAKNIGFLLKVVNGLSTDMKH